MFNYFWLFLQAVWVHAITLAAGCIVTVVIGIIEKRVLKRPISLKVEVGILLAFVFFACFQAWRDQYDIAKKVAFAPVQITNQVNVPPAPPAQVIIERPEGAKETVADSRMEILPFVAATEISTVTAGKIVGMNVGFLNRGPGDVEDIRNFERMDVVSNSDPKAKANVRREFKNARQEGERVDRKNGAKGPSLGPGLSAFNTARSPVLTQTDVDTILSGASLLYIQVWLRWKDLHGNVGTIDQCWFFQTTGDPNLGKPQVLHTCD